MARNDIHPVAGRAVFASTRPTATCRGTFACTVRRRGPPPRAINVTIGAVAIAREGERIRTDRAGVDELAWIAWSNRRQLVGRTQRRPAAVFPNKKLSHGVEVVAEGVLPMAAYGLTGGGCRSDRRQRHSLEAKPVR